MGTMPEVVEESQNQVTEVRPLTGNEAIARGAWEAGLRVAAAYPGTPSTEIMESLARYPAEDLHAQWSTNEKVALDVAMGASFAGSRALASMKHVGLNVAADPLFTLSYTGVRGGLVLVTADDAAHLALAGGADCGLLALDAGLSRAAGARSAIRGSSGPHEERAVYTTGVLLPDWSRRGRYLAQLRRSAGGSSNRRSRCSNSSQLTRAVSGPLGSPASLQ